MIKAAAALLAEQKGLKKKVYRVKNRPRWKRRNEGDVKKTETRRGLIGKRLERGTGIKEETKDERKM